jgi:hypothetical protein
MAVPLTLTLTLTSTCLVNSDGSLYRNHGRHSLGGAIATAVWLGVDATVVLFEKRGQATIQLKGVPLGGRISGVARFEPDGVTVDLDSDLGRALARRHVKITRAGVYLDYSTVWVTVRLPLGVGERTVHLARTVTLQHENSNEFP